MSAPPDLKGFETDDVEVNFRDLELMNELGRGSFGIVYKAKFCGINVASKSIKSGLDRQDEFEHEVNILKGLRHPNIVMLIGVAKDPMTEITYIVQEFVSGGSLDDYLGSSKHISFQEKITMCVDIVQGLWYIHQRDVLHRDIKAENILLEESKKGYKCKIADFGVSRLFTTGDEPVYSVGSTWWRAPEMFFDVAYGKSADIFSVGVLIYEIITRKTGLDIRIAMTVDNGTTQFGIEPKYLWNEFGDILSQVPKEFVDIAEKCCNQEPSLRPKTSELFDMVNQLSESVEELKLFVEKTLSDHCSSKTMVADGVDFWLEEIVSYLSKEEDYTQTEIPLTQIVHRLDNDLLQKTGKGLPEGDIVSTFCESIGINPEDSVQLEKFASDIWAFYYGCVRTLLNPIVLPYWRNGMIHGFIGKASSSRKLLKSKIEGEFIIRFSNSSPGALVMVCFHNNKIANIMTTVVQDKIIIGKVSCSTMTELFQTKNVGVLRYIHPQIQLETFLDDDSVAVPSVSSFYDDELDFSLPDHIDTTALMKDITSNTN